MEREQDTTPELDVVQLRQDIRSVLHQRLREAVEIVVEEELSAALGSGWYERTEGRRGYRNGSERRQVTTSAGSQTLRVPRGRLVTPDGSEEEFRSETCQHHVT